MWRFCLRRRRLHPAAMYDTDKRITDKYLRRKYLSNEEKLDPIKGEMKMKTKWRR